MNGVVAGVFRWAVRMALVLGLFVTVTAQASSVTAGKLILDQAWSRATPGGAKVGVGYVSIVNTGNEQDRLVAAESDIADRVEIHTTEMDGGVMRMRLLRDGIAIAPKSLVELKPGGLHLMLVGLKQSIKKGDELIIRLKFEMAGDIAVKFTAEGIGARAPSSGQRGLDVGGSASGRELYGSGRGGAPRGSTSGGSN